MADDDALGCAGGTRGVDHVRGLVDGEVGCVVALWRWGVAARTVDLVERDGRDAVGRGAEFRVRVDVGQQQARTGIGQHELDTCMRIGGIDRYPCGSASGDRPDRAHPLRAPG